MRVNGKMRNVYNLSREGMEFPRGAMRANIFSQTHPFGIVGVGKSSSVAENPGAGLRFLRNSQVVEPSARTGCAFCKLVFARIRRERWKFIPAEAVKKKLELRMHAGSASRSWIIIAMPPLSVHVDCFVSKASDILGMVKM